MIRRGRAPGTPRVRTRPAGRRPGRLVLGAFGAGVAAALALLSLPATSGPGGLAGPSRGGTAPSLPVRFQTGPTTTAPGGATTTSTSTTSSTTTSTTTPAGASSPAPANLLGGTDTTFSSGTGTWVGYGATLSQPAAPAGSLAVTSTGSAAPSAASGSPSSGGLTAAAPGTVYQALASVQPASGSLRAEAALLFYDSSGKTIDTVFGQKVTGAAGSWTPLFPALAVAPATAATVVMGVVVFSSSAGTTMYLTQPALRAARPATPAVAGPLRTSGNAVLDAKGNRITLRGVNLFGLEQSASPPVLTQDQVLQARAWGANAVRIALGEQLWLSTSCAYDPNYASAVDQMVRWVTTAGMVAILDLHWNAPGSGCPQAGQQQMADYPGSVQFWQQVAARYAANPLVAFDLYNEPHDITDAVWLSGGTATSTQGTYQTAGMQQLYDAVRSTGATNLVMVSGLDWANTPPSTLVQGTNIVYALHVYTCPTPWVVPPQCTAPNPYNPGAILYEWQTLSQSAPVMVTEFGWPVPSDGTYNRTLIAEAQYAGWGWTAFTWDGTTSSPWALVQQMPAGGPYQPSASGMPVIAALVGLPDQ